MRGYVITLLLIAFLVGSLFQAAEQTGMRIWNMFATMGIFLFGLVGSLAVARLQTRTGLSRVEAALKALEPEWVITDWSGSPGERPDYLLVGPGGAAAVCVDETPGFTLSWRARRQVERGVHRAHLAADWVRARLGGLPGGEEVPVRAYLLLTRRRALSEYSAGPVAVLNPEDLVEHLPVEGVVPAPLRFRFTRLLRGEEGARTGPVGRAFHGTLINEKCIGCTACVAVCPTEAISGERKQLHYIDPKLCIDCDACVRSCPVQAIADELGVYKPRIPKRVDWPKPVIDPVSCSGCDFCVEICPFNCLEIAGEGPFFGTAVLARPNSCVGCKECEEVCAKGAIMVLPPAELHPVAVGEGRA